MGALTFDKSELGNLEYSLTREMLATDRRGGYMSTTIVCCNTRKYHGLIVAPIDDSERDFILLSSLDETIILDGQRFNLALHRFRGVYEPRGHKYITDFAYTPTPTITYRIGDVVLRKELLWIHKRTQLMVRYTLVEGSANSIVLCLRPFLAYRDRHSLTKENLEADGYSYPIPGGVKCRLYEGFPWLHMQISRDDFEYVPAPDWYHDFEYLQEIARGYDGYEDLLTPGYFELTLKRGESVILSASTDEMISADSIKEDYKASIERRTHKIDFISCLHHSARQFVTRNSEGDTNIVAGYPWYGVVSRESLISLPGLTLEQGYKEDCIAALDTIVKKVSSENIPETFCSCKAIDTPLWFFRVAQMLEEVVGSKFIWDRYSDTMKEVLNHYLHGDCQAVSVHDNGLLWGWSDDTSITWMDTTTDSEHSARRNGYQVEVNALWYNAVCYMLDLAKKHKDKAFVSEWEWLPERAKSTFQSLFWLNEGYLADFVNHDTKNCSIRSNMIVACALNYKIVSEKQQIDIIRTIKQHLLTPKGLRSLSPRNPLYGVYGSATMNNSAPKNGSVWVWPLAMYVRACFDVLGEAFVAEAQEILNNFKPEIQTYGIGSIGEYFEADPPFNPRGAISQAWSVSAVLEISHMIGQYSKKEEKNAPAPKKTTVRKPRAKKVVEE
ncbi:MAG: glycogen debranching enzyme N-terminal domain-containing protein [Rikenellaceae bacterium]